MIENMNDFKIPIIKTGVRILRPKEYEALLRYCTKPHHRTMLQALLYTGMRYIEMQKLQKYPSWFDGEFIHLPRLADAKVKRTQHERFVRLNQAGKMAVEYFLRLKEPLPAYQNWRDNMIRWGINAGLDPTGLGVKTTRKTYESWLIFYFPKNMIQVIQSQGHNVITSVEYYLNMPFNEVDKIQMKSYVEGWI